MRSGLRTDGEGLQPSRRAGLRSASPASTFPGGDSPRGAAILRRGSGGRDARTGGDAMDADYVSATAVVVAMAPQETGARVGGDPGATVENGDDEDQDEDEDESGEEERREGLGGGTIMGGMPLSGRIVFDDPDERAISEFPLEEQLALYRKLLARKDAEVLQGAMAIKSERESFDKYSAKFRSSIQNLYSEFAVSAAAKEEQIKKLTGLQASITQNQDRINKFEKYYKSQIEQSMSYSATHTCNVRAVIDGGKLTQLVVLPPTQLEEELQTVRNGVESAENACTLLEHNIHTAEDTASQLSVRSELLRSAHDHLLQDISGAKTKIAELEASIEKVVQSLADIPPPSLPSIGQNPLPPPMPLAPESGTVAFPPETPPNLPAPQPEISKSSLRTRPAHFRTHSLPPTKLSNTPVHIPPLGSPSPLHRTKSIFPSLASNVSSFSHSDNSSTDAAPSGEAMKREVSMSQPGLVTSPVLSKTEIKKIQAARAGDRNVRVMEASFETRTISADYVTSILQQLETSKGRLNKSGTLDAPATTVTRLPSCVSAICAVSLSSVWAGCTGGVIKLLSAGTTIMKLVLESKSRVFDIIPVDSQVWVASMDSALTLIKPNSSYQSSTLKGHAKGPILALMRIKDMVWSIGADNTLRSWDIKKGRLKKTLQFDVNLTCMMLVNGHFWIGSTSSIRVVDMKTLQIQNSKNCESTLTQMKQVGTDNVWTLHTSEGTTPIRGCANVWDASFRHLATIVLTGAECFTVAGKMVWFGLSDGSIVIYNNQTMEVMTRILNAHDSAIKCITCIASFDPILNSYPMHIYSGTQAGQISAWETNQHTHNLVPHKYSGGGVCVVCCKELKNSYLICKQCHSYAVHDECQQFSTCSECTS